MTVVLTTLADAVLTVTLNRPAALNAVNAEVLALLAAAWRQAAKPEVRAVLLTGAGRGFCAGQDLAEPPVPDGLRQGYNPVILGLAALDKPVVAAVNGAAAGAGLSLACAADIRIVAERAKFVPAFSRLGLAPDAGCSYYLPRLIGYGRALSWLATGEPMTAARALAAGLADEVVADDSVLTVASDLARRLAAAPGAAAPLTKQLLARSGAASLADQLEAEARAQDIARGHPDRAAARDRVTAALRGTTD
jgi:2-(1,2-epoxy-1,2-dihydrophenyl)acetyl-CoA isomerase